MKFLLQIFLLFQFAQLNAQTTIDNSIRSNGSDSILIKNVGLITDSTNLVSANQLQSNFGQYFVSTNVLDTLIIQREKDLYNLSNGLVLFVQSSTQNTGNVFLKMDNQVFPIYKRSGINLDPNEILPQKVLILYYRDSTFTLLNPERSICPTGFVKVNKSYCIQKNETSGTFWNGVITCNALGARLCSWSEWYYACQNTTLGLTGRINNWEWVNSGQNEPSQGKIVGSGKCDITQHGTLNTNYGIRCCFSY